MKLLIAESPLQLLPTLVCRIGMNEAIFLQQVQFWIAAPRVGREADGRRWVYNSYESWREDNFPFWSIDTIKRTIRSLEEKGILLSRKDLNESPWDRTKWYSIDYNHALLQVSAAGSVSATPPNQSGGPAPLLIGTETTTETTTEIITPTSSPESGDAPKPKRERSEAQRANDAIIDAYYEAMGLDIKVVKPTPRMYGEIKNLRAADVSPDEIRGTVAMLQNDPYWREKDITLGVVSANIDKFRIRQASIAADPKRAENQVDPRDKRRWHVEIDPNNPPRMPVLITENQRDREIGEAKMAAWREDKLEWESRYGSIREWALANTKWPPDYGETL